MAKAKEPPTDALPTMAEKYSQLKRVGALSKDSSSGKIIDDWNKITDEASSKPETVDISPSISTLLAVKDEEELVSACTYKVHRSC